MNKTLIFLAIVSMLLIVGCGHDKKVSHHHKKAVEKEVAHKNVDKIHEYIVQQPDNSFLYWYLIYGNNSTYYYSSPRPTANFSGVQFSSSPNTSVNGVATRSVPVEVKEAVEKGVDKGELETEAEQEPEIVDETEIAGVENPDDAADNPATESSESESASESSSESSSSDSSSSSGSGDSSSSSSGDSGGGGGGD